MRARVVRAYTDRIDRTVHQTGSEVVLPESRAKELEGKGFVRRLGAEPDPGEADGQGGAPDLEQMTAAQLRDLIAERGGTAPKRANKAQLLEIAGAL